MTRWLSLVTVLVSTVGLTAWLATRPDADAAVVAAVPAASRAGSAPAAAAGPRPLAATTVAVRAPWPELSTEALRAWSEPAPPAPPPLPAAVAEAAPARQPAPAFPYRWIGQIVDGDETRAMLAGPQRSFGARVGDVLEAQWRIERITAGRIDITWLPGGDTVTLDTR